MSPEWGGKAFSQGHLWGDLEEGGVVGSCPYDLALNSTRLPLIKWTGQSKYHASQLPRYTRFWFATAPPSHVWSIFYTWVLDP